MRFVSDSPTRSAETEKPGCARDITKMSNDAGVCTVNIECDHLGGRFMLEIYGAWVNTGGGSEHVVLLSSKLWKAAVSSATLHGGFI